MVVTDSAGVIGNGGIVNGIPLAFIGQVRVKVSGKAGAGDYILPSGKGDGTAVAVPKAEMTLEKLMNAVGRAVESKETDGVARIKVMVGVK